MIVRVLTVIIAVWSVSGCALIESLINTDVEQNKTAETANSERLCWVDEQSSSITMDNNCDLDYWLQYWVEVDALSWPKRRTLIDELGENATSKLRKIFLSQSRGTPYQARLRAQSWADELMPHLTSSMRSLLSVLVYKPSQEMLEFESALTILSQINTNQSKELDEQRQRLQEQQQQIDQLLKIEASMMEKREGISQ
ncbi:hypothetical protein [Aliiglaciecola litoralis]